MKNLDFLFLFFQQKSSDFYLFCKISALMVECVRSLAAHMCPMIDSWVFQFKSITPNQQPQKIERHREWHFIYGCFGSLVFQSGSPISLKQENIVSPNPHSPWYKNPLISYIIAQNTKQEMNAFYIGKKCGLVETVFFYFNETLDPNSLSLSLVSSSSLSILIFKGNKYQSFKKPISLV